MFYRVQVTSKPGFRDTRAESLLKQAEALGVSGLDAVSIADLYFLQGELNEESLRRLVDTLLYDPVIEEATCSLVEADGVSEQTEERWTVEVTWLPGVTDSVAESLLEGARLIDLAGLECAATGNRYIFIGHLQHDDVQRIARYLLANEVIQTYTINRPVSPPFLSSPTEKLRAGQVHGHIEIVPLTQADDIGLEAISRQRRLSLDLAEMQAIQAFYRRRGREPTDVELEMLAQTWSEHCVHKTFKALITYEEKGPDGLLRQQQIDSLLKTYIRAATDKINKPWVRSAFVDNAGVVAFDDRFDLAFKVETHNHPSALEPFGGANTGVGGVVRDVIGVSARP